MSDDIYHKFKKDDVDQFMDNDIYLPTRTVYMGSASTWDTGEESGVDHDMAERMIKCLHILDTYDVEARRGDKPITIIMNNPGGDVQHGMAIYDAIKHCKNHVTIKVYGQAMSVGSIILQAADKRIMTRHSKIMIHYGELDVGGHAKTAYQWADSAKTYDHWMENMFLEKIGDRKIKLYKYLSMTGKVHEIPAGNAKNKLVEMNKQTLEQMLNFDTIIHADTALELNLIDEIEG